MIDKYDLWKSSFYAILPLIIIGVLIKLWVNETSPERIYYYRNAFFVGLPYFLTGALIKKNARHNCLNVRCLHVVIVAVLVVLFIVRYLIVGQSLIILTVIELDLLLLTAGIFFLTISYKQEADNIISWLGRKYSLYIYIFHLLIMSAIQMAVSYLPTELNNVYMYFNPIVVFLFSIGLTYVLNKMKIIKI